MTEWITNANLYIGFLLGVLSLIAGPFAGFTYLANRYAREEERFVSAYLTYAEKRGDEDDIPMFKEGPDGSVVNSDMDTEAFETRARRIMAVCVPLGNLVKLGRTKSYKKYGFWIDEIKRDLNDLCSVVVKEGVSAKLDAVRIAAKVAEEHRDRLGQLKSDPDLMIDCLRIQKSAGFQDASTELELESNLGEVNWLKWLALNISKYENKVEAMRSRIKLLASIESWVDGKGSSSASKRQSTFEDFVGAVGASITEKQN